MRGQIRNIDKARVELKKSGNAWHWHSNAICTVNADRSGTAISGKILTDLVNSGELVFETKLRNDVGNAYADLYKYSEVI